MMNFISAQANVAAEHLSANLPGSIVSTCTFFLATCLTLIFHWGVNGIAAGMLAMRCADFLVRLIPTARRILSWEIMCNEPEGLNTRMLSFAGQSVIGMLLALIVWDRSEVVLLRHLSSSIQQVAFYSVAFSLAERLLIVPTVFGSATGATIFAQYGRDKTKLPALTAAAFRYNALTSIPMHAIAMALAGSIVLVLYGAQYRGAIAVAVIAPLLCLPKAFLSPIQNLFESTEEQQYFIATTAVASVIDIAVASYLIPRFGAVGACLGSGAAQTTAVCAMWAIGVRRYNIRLPWGQFFKLSAISTVAALVTYFAVRQLPPVWSLVVGGLTAFAFLALLGYWFKLLEPEDCRRFKVLAALCPRVIRVPIDNVLTSLSNRPQAKPEPSFEVKL
jgi:O-antigen/teichoic acid export membrane protein